MTRSWEQLEAEAEREYGEAWLPDKEDSHPRTLVGTIVSYDQGPESAYTGERPWIANVEDRDGKQWCIWLNRAVLIGEFDRQKPMPGERIAIRYRGQAEKASQPGMAPAQLYKLTVDRDRVLPESFSGGELEAGAPVRRDVQPIPGKPSDIPSDDARSQVDREFDAQVADADVVEEGDEKGEGDDPLPF
jgi:hypothetical protein